MRKLNNQDIQDARKKLENQYKKTVILEEICPGGQEAIFSTVDQRIKVSIDENNELFQTPEKL